MNTPEECWIFEQRVSHLQCASDHQSHGAKLKRKIVINGKLQRPAQLTKAPGAIERMAGLGRSRGSHRLERRAQTGGGRGEASPYADMGCRTAIQPWRRGDGVEWRCCQVICQRRLGAPCEGPCRCHGSTGKIAGRLRLPPRQCGMRHHRRVPWWMVRYARSATA